MSTNPPSMPNPSQPEWGAGAPQGGPGGTPPQFGGDGGTPPQAGGYGGGMPPGPGLPPSPGMGGGQPPKKKSKAPLIIGIIAAVVVVCCGGGGAYSYLSGDDGTPSSHASATAEASDGGDTGDGSSGDGGEEDVTGDLDQFHQGDCLTMEESSNDVTAAECGPGTYTVLKRVDGTTKSSACDGTDATQELYQEGRVSHRKDFILCIGKTKNK